MATISTTARPAYVYDAVGDQWVPIAWRVLPAGVGSAPALTFTGDSNTGLWSPAADTVAFSTGGTERMRIDSAGRMLIGSDTAQNVGGVSNQALQIFGGGPARATIIRGSADTVGSGVFLGKSRNTAAGSFTIVQSGDQIGQIRFNADNGLTLSSEAARIDAAVDAAPSSTSMPGRLVFYTTAASAVAPTERMRIDSSGNVGIGVPAPEVRLHLRAADGVQAQVAADTFINAGTSSRVLLRKARGTSGSPTVVQSGDNLGDTFFQGWDGSAWRDAALVRGSVDGTPGASDMPGRLEFYTTADGSASLTERMRIDNAGNVGIGTTSYTTSGSNARLMIATGDQHLITAGRWSANQYGANLFLVKSRGTTAGTFNGIVQSGDELGNVLFAADNGSSGVATAGMAAFVDGTPSATAMPSRLVFYTCPTGTTAYAERMRIDNAGLITGTGTSLGAWTAYTPTLSGTGWAIGNGTATGFYCQVGKIVYFRAKITFGSTSTYGGSPLNLSLPVSATGSPVAGQNVAFFDTSASLRYLASMEYASATAIAPRSVSGSLTLSAVTTTVPFTWATGDTIDYSGTYEAA